jgi:hypothetical protein
MAVPQPNLDDRTFDQLTAEGMALIARHFPAWTDYNPSDPGITLTELFAFLVEAAIYQINRVPERSLERFAGLVGIAPAPGEPIAQTLARALQAIQQRYRAITGDDFEAIARASASGAIARAHAVAVTGGSAPASTVFPADQFIKLIIVPVDGTLTPAALAALCDQVFAALTPRRLITTRINVVPPDRTLVTLAVTVVRDSDVDGSALGSLVAQTLTAFLDDRTGGDDGGGWPFGRPVYRSDLYRVIEGVAGIDHVATLLLNGDDSIGEIPLVSPLSLIGPLAVTVTVLQGALR